MGQWVDMEAEKSRIERMLVCDHTTWRVIFIFWHLHVYPLSHKEGLNQKFSNILSKLVVQALFAFKIDFSVPFLWAKQKIKLITFIFPKFSGFFFSMAKITLKCVRLVNRRTYRLVRL